jgi:hypothetical protein
MESLSQNSGSASARAHGTATAAQNKGSLLTTALGGVLGDAGALAVELVVFGSGKLLRRLRAVHATAHGGAGEAQLGAGAREDTLGEHGGVDGAN